MQTIETVYHPAKGRVSATASGCRERVYVTVISGEYDHAYEEAVKRLIDKLEWPRGRRWVAGPDSHTNGLLWVCVPDDKGPFTPDITY